MADLEQLALKKDRGYLVGLVLLMIVGIGAGLLVFSGLTSQRAGGCMASMFVGGQPTTETPTK